MNKPLAMMINETKIKLADACNKSELPISILDLVVQGIYSEVHSLAEKQALEEQKYYMEAIKNECAENCENG